MRSAGSSSDISFVDEINLTYSKRYESANGRMKFTVAAGEIAGVGGFQDNLIELFELDANGEAIRKMLATATESGGSFGFTLAASASDRIFVAYDSQFQAINSAQIEPNFPSNLLGTDDSSEVLVISPRSFSKPALGIVGHKKREGIEAQLLFTDDIYDEVGFGRKSDQAIKDFIRYVLDARVDPPKYVILFGDSSYDMRNYNGQIDRDLIPTHLVDTKLMETSSDGWLVDYDDDGIEDIPIGRLPAGNYDEAEAIYDKFQDYYFQSPRVEKTSVLVADNGFRNYSDVLEDILPEDVSPVHLDRSNLSNTALHDGIIDGFNNEAMAITFTGHGSPNVWIGADVFQASDALTLTNQKLPFVMAMTCLNGYSHNTSIDSISETLLKSPNGAIAIWASSGSTYAADQIGMSSVVTAGLFDGQSRIGDLIRQAKLSTNDRDARMTWQLIGDPTTVIK